VLVKRPFQEKINSTLRFRTSPPLTLLDDLRNEAYQAEWDDKGEDKKLLTDYGKLVWARNPYASDRVVIMICGIYGFGTWGGAKLLTSEKFLRKCEELGDSFEFECVYRVGVHEGKPEFVEELDFRPLGPGPGSVRATEDTRGG
jgi:hypothetical protein